MSRRNPRTITRDKEIVELYFRERWTVQELAHKHGLSPASIRLITGKAKLDPETKVVIEAWQAEVADQPRRPRVSLYSDLAKPISPLHHAIGARFDFFRNHDCRAELTSMALELGMSRHRLRAAELGKHDWTLSELMTIARKMEIPLQDLLTPRMGNC